MDKFESAKKASSKKLVASSTADNEIQSEPVKAAGSSAPSASKRWLWAASLCSLAGVASLSYILVTDHIRISNLQEQIAQRRMGVDRVAQHVLAAQASASASVSVDIDVSAAAQAHRDPHLSTQQHTGLYDMYVPAWDHVDVVQFSSSLDYQLDQLEAKIVKVEANMAQSAVDINVMQSTVDVMLEDNDALKYDVQVLDTTEQSTTWKFENTKNNLQAFEDKVTADIQGKPASIQTRLSDLENGSYQVALDVDSVKTSLTQVEIDLTTEENELAALSTQITGIQKQIDRAIKYFNDNKDVAKGYIDLLKQLEQQSIDAQAQITSFQSFDTDIQVQVNVIQAQVDTINGVIGNDKDQLKLIEGQLDAIENDQLILQDELDINRSEQNSLEVNMDNLESKHTRLDIKLTRIEATNEDLQGQVTDLQNQVDNWEEKFTQNIGLKTTIKDKMTSQEDSIASLSASVDSTEVTWTSTTAQVTSLNTQVTTLEGISFNEIVYDQSSSKLSNCVGSCKQCVRSHYSQFPDYNIYKCIDNKDYGYGKQCTSGQDKSKCATDPSGYCHLSWPLGDADRNDSTKAECRTVPQNVINGAFAYGPACDANDGLCIYGCQNGNYCAWSWEQSDKLMANSPAAMCRCTNFF